MPIVGTSFWTIGGRYADFASIFSRLFWSMGIRSARVKDGPVAITGLEMRPAIVEAVALKPIGRNSVVELKPVGLGTYEEY